MINFSWGTLTKWEKIENLYMYSWLYHITWNVYIIVNELITTLFSFELAAGCVIARNQHNLLQYQYDYVIWRKKERLKWMNRLESTSRPLITTGVLLHKYLLQM